MNFFLHNEVWYILTTSNIRNSSQGEWKWILYTQFTFPPNKKKGNESVLPWSLHLKFTWLDKCLLFIEKSSWAWYIVDFSSLWFKVFSLVQLGGEVSEHLCKNEEQNYSELVFAVSNTPFKSCLNYNHCFRKYYEES